MSGTNDHDMRRLHTNEMEVGITDVVQRHARRHVVKPKAITQKKLDFEHARPRWMREMAAESIGVFFYVYPGIASQASFFFNDLSPAFSSIFQIGWAYAIGIAFAIITCGATSGGHFNPAVTICLAVWQGFPWKKVPYYILAQVFGAFLAGMLLVGQYHPQMIKLADTLTAAGISPNSLGGPGSVLCAFPAVTQTNMGYLFFIEFFVDSFIGIVIWSVLDPGNPFISPASAPFVIGLAYANMIWGFANVTISTNLARDLGTRIVAAIFFGGDAFNKYSPIALFVNIPATLLSTCVYELILKDSFAAIAGGHTVHEEGEDGLRLHLTKTGTIDQGAVNTVNNQTNGQYAYEGKGESPV